MFYNVLLFLALSFTPCVNAVLIVMQMGKSMTKKKMKETRMDVKSYVRKCRAKVERNTIQDYMFKPPAMILLGKLSSLNPKPDALVSGGGMTYPPR